MDEVKHIFRPEFLNRVDELIVFHALGEDHIVQIAGLMLREVSRRMAQQGMFLEFEEEAVRVLAQAGYDTQYGARPLRRAIQRQVEDALSEEILAGNVKLGEKVVISAEDGKLTFKQALPALTPQA